MYTETDFMTPRERINESLLKRALEDTPSQRAQGRELSCRCNSSASDRPSNKVTWGLEEHPLASVYAPLQQWRNLYDLDDGLDRGTIFKELDLPFVCGENGTGGICRGR